MKIFKSPTFTVYFYNPFSNGVFNQFVFLAFDRLVYCIEDKPNYIKINVTILNCTFGFKKLHKTK